MRVLTCSLACVLATAAVCDAARLLELVLLDALQAALNAGKPISFATPGRPESEASIPVCTLLDGSPRWLPGIPKGDAHTISVTLSVLGLKQKKMQNNRASNVKAGDFEVHPLLAGRVRQDVTLADDEAACLQNQGPGGCKCTVSPKRTAGTYSALTKHGVLAAASGLVALTLSPANVGTAFTSLGTGKLNAALDTIFPSEQRLAPGTV
jgi:hypothetical protein